jgi:hypothetical protein
VTVTNVHPHSGLLPLLFICVGVYWGSFSRSTMAEIQSVLIAIPAASMVVLAVIVAIYFIFRPSSGLWR